MVIQKEVERRSLINQVISKDIMFQIEKVGLIPGITKNARGIRVKNILHEEMERLGIPYEPLGVGTNRVGVKIDGYVIKASLDMDGKIDNRREYKYSKAIQPYVTKTYECMPTGLLAACEYIVPFDIQEYHERKSDMRYILDDISKMGYLVGDVGITGKNYVNWGVRPDNTIAILDYAYIYSVGFNTFKCHECEEEPFLKWDESFVTLTCPNCGKKYEFGDIRRRITRQQQEKEIGDIRLMGYNLTKPKEVVEYNSLFEYEPKKKIKKKKKDKTDELLDRIEKEIKESEQEWF